ncbi:MAG: hydroxymethylbilane synthase [Verrucomicrobia bacterium]|nr:hydroxymethylbilane synthase [Verrucomicrobiota bacterium]
MSQTITLATRKSPLALAQTLLVESAILKAFPGTKVVQDPMTTTGDQRLAWSLEEKGGKGLFTKELEIAMLEGRADLAVHSAKDMPTEMEPGLVIVGFLPRETVEDVLVKRVGIESISKLATGSPRRRAQAKLFLPDAEFVEIRGNVGTRLSKIQSGEADATILASAGLRRLGISEWEGLEFEYLSLNQMIPAVGQGAIALQCRAGEEERFRALTDPVTNQAVCIEREFLTLVDGGCQTAFAAHFMDNTLLAFHESAGRFTLSFNSLDMDEIRQAIKTVLGEFRL